VKRLLIEDGHLRGVELDDGRAIPREAVFVRPRFVPNNDLLVGLGCAVDETGWVIADATGGTSAWGLGRW
jgi:thioredoxin reductase